MSTMLDLARKLVKAAPKCACGRLALHRYSDPYVVSECCSTCCGLLVQQAAHSLTEAETYKVSDLPEGKHAAEVAIAYGLEEPWPTP